MAENQPSSKCKLSETKFHNWIKSGLATMYTRDGVLPFILDDIIDFQQKTYSGILTLLGLHAETKCSACATDVLVCDKVFENCKRKTCMSYHRTCPKEGLCDLFKDNILKAHRFHGPSWINSDAKLWCSDPWQVAKCYMPREGYSTQMTAVETDFNGIVSVILNHEHFSRRVSIDLTDRNNIFRKARDVSKLVRHSAPFELDDDEFQSNLDILLSILQENQIAQYQEAQYASRKLSELKTSEWSIFTSKDDIFEVMKHSCSSGKATPETKEAKDRIEMLKIAIKVIEKNTNTDVKSIIWQMQHSFNKFEEEKEQKRKRIDIRKRLIQTYQLECSTLPISALFEEEDAPLLNFYVQPAMNQIDYHNIRKYTAEVESYFDIFDKDGQTCKNIYLTGNAGTGKTAVCQKMVLCWCHAQSVGISDDNFSQKDVDAMKRFDFLFFVSLRDTELCHIEDMIQQQLVSRGREDILSQILEEEKCLIILDGLDEWTHPNSTAFCPANKKIPHRRVYGNCVYLTTSRPWKIEANRLKTKEIDQQIELKGLDQKATQKLTTYVVKYLNKKYLKNKNPTEFQAFLERKKQIETVSGIPIIRIQLISLWFKDIDTSSNYSRCAIYADTLDMLFQRATEREINQQEENRRSEKVKQLNALYHDPAPEVISKSTFLTEFLNLLYKVGCLAFDMLFKTPAGESSLVFKRNIVKNYDISDLEMKFLLFVGILSKNKVIGPHQDRLVKLTFLHKSYQEYFAALHIAMANNFESSVNTILSKCKSLVEFLRYEQMFVFLSGMNEGAIENISESIQNVVSVDTNVKIYRKTAHYKFGMVVVLKPYTSEMLVHGWSGEASLRALQTLLLHCMEENNYSGHRPVELSLSDIFIGEEYTPELKRLLKSNSRHLKSVSTDVFTGDMSSIDTIEKLVVNENNYCCRVDVTQYENCIVASRSSLTSLSISNCVGRVNLSTTTFKNLTSLALFDVLMRHQEVQEIFSFISKTLALTQLFLYKIKCSEHEDECGDNKLDLSSHTQLQFLRLQKLHQQNSYKTKLNSENLQFLLVEDNTDGKIVGSAIEDIRNSHKLTELDLLGMENPTLIDSFIDTIPTLQNLEKVSFINVDFGDRILRVNIQNKKPMKMFNFFHTTLSLESFCRFVDSLPDNGAIVLLQACKVKHSKDGSKTDENFEAATDYVRRKHIFEITFADRSRLSFNSKDEI